MKKYVLVLIALFAIGSVAAGCMSDSTTMIPPPPPPPQAQATPGNVVSAVAVDYSGGTWTKIPHGAEKAIKRGGMLIYLEGQVVEVKTSQGMVVITTLTGGGVYLVQQQYLSWRDFHVTPKASQAIQMEVAGNGTIKIRPTDTEWELQ